MLLAIDAGNSNLKLAVFEDEELLAHWRLTTGVQRTRDEYGSDVRHLFQLFDLDPKKLEAIVIASVVPALNLTLTQMAEMYFNLTPLFVDHTTRTTLLLAYDPPSDLGADRIVDAVAALEKYGGPCIVVDFGTATTFNVINGLGEFVGGAISPGLMTCAEALFSRAAKLPRVEFKRPAKIIGSSTVAAMQSGWYHGYAGLVDALIMRMIDELGEAPRVIATGGLAHVIAPASPSIQVVDDTLTLEGLRLVYQQIRA
ncbi:MAG TPA: type III pantothenate kinase [Pyrinomonadaceae bacterium]|jgi:type III pantothenate kinase|nr:type III pantothenate kinase [Pyrinomonadaceae bacterium]